MTTKTQPVTERAVETLIPLDKLKKSPRNARITSHTDAAIGALAASIHAKGMLQNLVVEPERDADGAETGCYYVTAGEGRRLAQLLRAKRKQIKKSEPIRCVVDATNDPFEVSLDENVTRSSMHPADQFEAFLRLSQERGWSAEDVAARFGVTANIVRQRLRLGAVSPRLMQLYREDELTLDQLMAFAISEDHARQEQVYDNLAWNREPRNIRHRMMESHVPASDRRVIFVGMDVYADAGGVVVRDLFSEDGDGYIEDAALLDRLALEQLLRVAAEVQASGWKWAQAYLDYPHGHGLRRMYPRQVELPAADRERLDALRSEYDELNEQYEGDEEEDVPADLDARLEALESEIHRISERKRVFDPEVMARGGVLVTLDQDGTARIERGFVRPEDEAQAEPRATGDRGDNDGDASPNEHGGAGPSTAADDEDTDPDKPMSDAVVRDLTAHRTLGLRLALGERPDVALLAVTHALAAQTFYLYDEVTCLEIRSTATSLVGHADGIGETSAAKAFAKRHEAWAAQMPEEAADLWAFVAALDDDRRMGLFAHCAARTAFAVRQRSDRKSGALAAADRLADAISLDMTAHWAPTVQAYLGRITKAQIAQAVREGVSEKDAGRISSMKKLPMAEAAEELLAGRGWLPALLRTPKAGNADAAQSYAEAA